MEISAPLLEAAIGVLSLAAAYGTIRARITSLEKLTERLPDDRTNAAVLTQRVLGLEREIKSLRSRYHDMQNERARGSDSDPPTTDEAA